MRPIHVGIPISYDYKYLPICLSRIYEAADKITIAIDKDRKTWAGKKYDFDENIITEILNNDPIHKISVYEDDFSVPDLSTMECDRRERRMIRDFMKSSEEGAWHLQLDTDEYFVNFEGFVKYLHDIEAVYSGDVTVNCRLVTIFKLCQQGLIIAEDDSGLGYFPVASIGGCRFSPSPKEIIINADFNVLHQSWGREEKEIFFKISNWGHNQDFNIEEYFEFWKSVNKYNARYIRDCHPLNRFCGWNRLRYLEGDLLDILNELQVSESIPVFHKSTINRAKLDRRLSKIKKSKLIQSLKPLIKRVIGKR